MADDLLIITRKVQAEEFCDSNASTALANCQEKHIALFMPEIIDTRIDSAKGSKIWQNWYTALSIRATGKTAQGNAVVVYAHRQNHFSNPQNILEARKGLINGAGKMPQEEFQALVDRDGEVDQFKNRLVWVIDYQNLTNSSSGVIPVSKALRHPQTIPFVGGETRAERYLEKHVENYGSKIGIWHSDDLSEQGPLARLLFVGDLDYLSLYGYNLLNLNARFVGVSKSAEGTSPKIVSPTSEQVIKVFGEYLAPRYQEELSSRIKALFK